MYTTYILLISTKMVVFYNENVESGLSKDIFFGWKN